LACNLISVENKIVVAKGVSQQFKENLAHEGYLIEEIDTAEYRKGGGSIKCLSFEF
jgi:N-dimethylarginine dimethylaminohydrolase